MFFHSHTHTHTHTYTLGLHSFKDAIEKAINIMSLEPPSEKFIQERKSRSPSSDASEMEAINSDDIEKVREGYPREWNFSMNILSQPQPTYQPAIEIPPEEIGNGANRHVYFVRTNLSRENDWIELPSVTPRQINVSRRVKKYLTGNLSEVIESYPEFPGTELNYLRAIIARISSSTHVAPKDFYKIGTAKKNKKDDADDADDEESENGEGNFWGKSMCKAL